MANHFPSLPTFELASVTYTFALIDDSYTQDGNGFSVSGMSYPSALWLGAPNTLGTFLQLTLPFDTPGTFGSFDQDTAETTIKSIANGMAQLMADTSGATLAAIKATINIYRNWTWAGTGGYSTTFSDTLSF